jgi:hypothetical protein
MIATSTCKLELAMWDILIYTPSLVEDLSPLCAAGQTNGEYFALMREAIERRLRLL